MKFPELLITPFNTSGVHKPLHDQFQNGRSINRDRNFHRRFISPFSDFTKPNSLQRKVETNESVHSEDCITELERPTHTIWHLTI